MSHCTMINTLCTLPVQQLKGEYVKRNPDAHKVYLVEGYDRGIMRWCLIDCDDMNKSIMLKTGTLLVAGFTY